MPKSKTSTSDKTNPSNRSRNPEASALGDLKPKTSLRIIEVNSEHQKAVENNPYPIGTKAWRKWNTERMTALKLTAPLDSGDDVFHELRRRAQLLANTRPSASRAAVRDAVGAVFAEANKCLAGVGVPTADPVKTALEEFVRDIQLAGGVYLDKSTGHTVPVGDPEWPDLAITYLHACKALGVKPKFHRSKQTNFQT